jgi:hypothetical protein
MGTIRSCARVEYSAASPDPHIVGRSLVWYNRNMTQSEEIRSQTDATYARMRSVIDTMASIPGSFNLEELAQIVVNAASTETLVRMAMDMLLHKGRQHCGGKIRRPDGEEGVMSDGSRGRFPRAVPVDRRGTSTWVGWAFSDEAQRFDAAHRRAAQANGLGVEAQRITAAIEAQRQARQVAVDPAGDGVIEYHREGENIVIDGHFPTVQDWASRIERRNQTSRSVPQEGYPTRNYDINDPDSAQVRATPNHGMPEKEWDGGDWLFNVVRDF